MKKNSVRAQRIHAYVHSFMEATATGDTCRRSRAFAQALGLSRRLVVTPWGHHYVDLGYDVLWFVQIALQHPEALAADPTLNHFVHVTFPTSRQGERDARAGWGRQDNPYDAYIDEERHDAWLAGWEASYDDDDDLMEDPDYKEEVQ
jgi:hypothetical protein